MVRSKSLKKIYRVAHFARTFLKRVRGSDYEVNDKLYEEERPSIKLEYSNSRELRQTVSWR